MSSFSFGLYCESGIGKEIKIFKISTTSAEIIPLFNNRIPKLDPFLSNSKPTLDSCRIKKNANSSSTGKLCILIS